MKKYIKYFGFITLFITTLALGIYLGTLLETYQTNQINGNLYNSNKIAVVNLDEGVQYQNKSRNFAKELLESYSEDYVLTGLEDAKTGITDGRYGGYVILPSDFSNNVVSINTMPQKSLLKYEVSGDLSQNATDKAWQSVMKLKEQLNDDIGYVYISSILNEFHDGQLNALKVLSNDSEDKEVLMAISNLDLVATLDIREVARLQNNIENLDVNPDFETNKAIIEAVDTAYKGYLNETASELSSLKEEENSVNSDIANITNNAAILEGVFKDDGTSNYSLMNTEIKMTTFKTLLGDNIQNINTLIETAESSSSSQTNLIKNSVSTQLDELNKETANKHNEVLKTQSDSIEAIYKSNFLYGKSGTTVKLSDYTELNALAEKYDKEKSDYIFASNRVNKKIIDGCLDYIETLSSEGVTETLKDHIIVKNRDDKDMVKDIKIIAHFKNYKNAASFTLNDYLNLYFEEKPVPIDLEDNTTLQSSLQIALNKDLNSKLTKSQLDVANLDLKDTLTTNLFSKIKKIKEQFNILSSFDGTSLKHGTAELITISDTMTSDIINEEVKKDLTSLNDKQKNQKNQLLDTINEHQSLSDQLIAHFMLYDPLSYIDEEEIANYVNDYDKNNTQTQRKIEKKNNEYIQFVDDSYKNADEQVGSLRDDVSKYQQESDKKVITGLQAAKQKKDETTLSNQSLMNSYISKLPYTRTGSVGNSVVYDFVTSPFEMEGRKAEISLTTSGVNFPTIFITISGVLIVIWVVISFATEKKKEQK